MMEELIFKYRNIDIDLNHLMGVEPHEEKRLGDYTEKQRETYLKRKFINVYRKWVDGSIVECHRLLNLWLKQNGHKQMKSYTTTHNLWYKDNSFMPLNIINYQD